MAKTDQPNLDQLEAVAERIFAEDMRFTRGYSAEIVARRAFQKAKAFCEVAEAVRGGEEIKPLKVADEALFCLVDLWDGAKGQHGEMAHDENGKTLQEVMPIDRYSFAPNLPAGHPVNQRFLPNAIKAGRLCDKEGALLTTSQLTAKGLVPSAN